MSNAGHVLTNAHVVDRCRTIRASTAALIEPAGISIGPKFHALFGTRPMTVVAIDAQNDLAVLASSKPSSAIECRK